MEDVSSWFPTDKYINIGLYEIVDISGQVQYLNRIHHKVPQSWRDFNTRFFFPSDPPLSISSLKADNKNVYLQDIVHF